MNLYHTKNKEHNLDGCVCVFPAIGSLVAMISQAKSDLKLLYLVPYGWGGYVLISSNVVR